MVRWLRHLVALALAVIVFTASAYADEIPRLMGRVNDYAQILTPEQEASLDASLARIETYPGNPQVVLLTTPSMDGLEIEEYSLQVARAWGIGQAERNNGLVIVSAPNERALRFEVGYGLEGAIPDAMKIPIFERRMKPLLQQEPPDYFGAFTAGIAVVDTLIKGETTGDPVIDEAPVRAERDGKRMLVLMIGGFLAFLAGFIHWSAGGLVGGTAGTLLGLWLSAPLLFFGGYVLVGIVIGLLAHPIGRAMLESGWATNSSGSWGGGSRGGGFRGGGGGFGGGGFSGRY